jgi:hypothetical protein
MSRRRKPPWKDGDDRPIIDPATGKPMVFHEEHGPIDPLEDQLDEYTPKYRSLREANEAFKRSQEEGDEDE